MSRFNVTKTSIADLVVVERKQVGDSRGFLSRLFCAEELGAAGWRKPVVQINQTITQKCGTVRGMHYQRMPHPEMKLVTCLHGSVWDVAVDLRFGSATFLQWHAEELSATNHRALLIPEGFAHGFQALRDDCELVYLHSAAYAQEAEDGLNPKDAKLSISWPLDITEMSIKDARRPELDEQFEGMML
jgi:dTDP-4-dehydrorhamnose 3,5-epimerase